MLPAACTNSEYSRGAACASAALMVIGSGEVGRQRAGCEGWWEVGAHVLLNHNREMGRSVGN